jgi:hypothetical protein
MSKITGKDVSAMAWACVAIAAIPLCLLVTRPRTLSGASIPELTITASSAREEKILEEMSRRYDAVSLNFTSPDKEPDPQFRWQEIQNSLARAGAESDEAQQVIKSAQENLQGAWPCFAERGYLQGQSVWLVVGSSPHNTGFGAWICPPSAAAIRREKIARYCTDTQVAIVDTQPPYKTLNPRAPYHRVRQ